MTGTVHIVGAGLSGLACATALAASGLAVRLHEATDHAGGRCRSWHDAVLDRVIDNGNHLILGANRECLSYLDRIGGRQGLISADPVRLPFLDLRSGLTWPLRPGTGPLPFWLADPARRTPDSRLIDYLPVLKLAFAGPDRRVADLLPEDGPLAERLWKPLAVSILNTPYRDGSARLLWSVFRRTLLRGAAACRPLIAGPGGLSAALVDPALTFLADRHCVIRFGHRLRKIERAADGAAISLVFNSGEIPVGGRDHVVLALPAEAAAPLLPGVPMPDRFHPILNAHFRLDRPVALPGGLPWLGLVGGVAEWLFRRDDIVSVTVSAADTLIDRPADELAALLWQDVALALGLDPATPPANRIIKEKRATHAGTPAQERRRPAARLARNLHLAGDWTDTGLPPTIEGAVQSGHHAARLVRRAAGHRGNGTGD